MGATRQSLIETRIGTLAVGRWIKTRSDGRATSSSPTREGYGHGGARGSEGLTRAPARVGSMRDEVVDDGEAAGSSGGARGGSNRRRFLQGFRGSELAIAATPTSIGLANGARRSGEGWGVRWCAPWRPGNALFIEAWRCYGAGLRSTSARRFRRAVGLGEGAAVFSSSRRS